jgi:hypothetical protein
MCVVNQARPAIAQQELPAIGFRFCDQGQKHVSHFWRDSSLTEQLERSCEIDHLGDRRRLFQTPSAQSLAGPAISR